jgi:hypothetical protein
MEEAEDEEDRDNWIRSSQSVRLNELKLSLLFFSLSLSLSRSGLSQRTKPFIEENEQSDGWKPATHMGSHGLHT